MPHPSCPYAGDQLSVAQSVYEEEETSAGMHCQLGDTSQLGDTT
jgi:hypothetical protein